MWRRNAERVDTEEPEEHQQDVSENNSITEEEHGEEGEFVGASDHSSAQESSTILESLPEDEEVTTGGVHVDGDVDVESPGVEGAEPTATTTTTPATLTSSRERTSARRVHGFSLRDLEEEREIVQRRSQMCVLLSSFLLLRLWIQAVMTGDFGLLLLCLVFTSWTARFVRYTQEREEELNRLINDWDENAAGEDNEGEPTSLNDPRLRRMSFQSQLALAIMQSQIQLMEGGYGHPDGGASTPGVGADAKSHWDRFEYKSIKGDYGSVELKNIEEEPQCSICLCEYEKGDKLVSLPCKHVFHDDCITSWTDNNTRCPLCNSDLESVVTGDEIV